MSDFPNRIKRRAHLIGGPSDGRDIPMPLPESLPWPVAAHNAASTALDAALVVLTAAERRVLALRFGEDLSVAETAQVMGLNVGAVKAATYRATQKLRRYLIQPEPVLKEQ